MLPTGWVDTSCSSRLGSESILNLTKKNLLLEVKRTYLLHTFDITVYFLIQILVRDQHDVR